MTVSITTVTSREFNQNPSDAKKAAQNGVVFITDRGQPAHVLLNIDTYRKLTGEQLSLLDAIAQSPGPDAPDFEPVRISGAFRAADLS
jgi:PHD/YefM family antitoxin component YafN of YafNO toxin-antitoxin module